MKNLFCKNHCPSFICFCKQSSSTYVPPRLPLKLENVASSGAVITVANDEVSIELKEESIEVDGKQSQTKNLPKSSLRKGALVDKKSVQWMDFLGKQLVEVREFESSETEDSSDVKDHRNKGCVCVIL